MYTGILRIPTNRFCNRCHSRVYHSDIKGYPYVCHECDENMFTFETYKKKEEVMEDNCLFYMVDVDIYKEDYGVIETVKSDLFRSKSLSEAKEFANKYAKQKKNFDIKYLLDKDGDFYEMTIRKYYKEPTESENGDWDDWDTIEVPMPKEKTTKMKVS